MQESNIRRSCKNSDCEDARRWCHVSLLRVRIVEPSAISYRLRPIISVRVDRVKTVSKPVGPCQTRVGPCQTVLDRVKSVLDRVWVRFDPSGHERVKEPFCSTESGQWQSSEDGPVHPHFEQLIRKHNDFGKQAEFILKSKKLQYFYFT